MNKEHRRKKVLEIKWWWFKILPANAISGRFGGGNDDETFAAAKKSNLFLNIYIMGLT